MMQGRLTSLRKATASPCISTSRASTSGSPSFVTRSPVAHSVRFFRSPALDSPSSRCHAATQSGTALRMSAQKQQLTQQRSSKCHAASIDASAMVLQSQPEQIQELKYSAAVSNIVAYACNIAKASETYEVHAWMLLLGLLKEETCVAAVVLQDLGLDDLYGAWHEVLWALHVSDGLKPRAFTADIVFDDKSALILRATTNFATWHGKDKVQSEDLLMALANGNILTGLFPDLPVDFAHVRVAIEARQGRCYVLPLDEPETETAEIAAPAAEDAAFI